MENQEIFYKYKFGVVYVKANQTQEEEMFSNVGMSKDFEEFLKQLGNKTEMKGFTGFAGGLDVKHNSTGTHSVYTKFKDFEIMYHVSTLLPFQVEDKQRVERKRHIGNDIVVVIFKEGDQVIDPLIFTSQFNHVFAVVQKEEGNYRMSFVSKPGVRAFGPPLCLPAVKSTKDFREFFLTKLINAERAAMNSAEFKAKMITTRKLNLESTVHKFLSKDVKKPQQQGLVHVKSGPAVLQSNYQQTIDDLIDIGKDLAARVVKPKEFDPQPFESSLEKL